jgi:hypothetical protein
VITTKVNMMVPKRGVPQYIDVTSALNESSIGKSIMLNIFNGEDE